MSAQEGPNTGWTSAFDTDGPSCVCIK